MQIFIEGGKEKKNKERREGGRRKEGRKEGWVGL
jgi:hypothetical protein